MAHEVVSRFLLYSECLVQNSGWAESTNTVCQPPAVRALPRLNRGSTLPILNQEQPKSRVNIAQIWPNSSVKIIGDSQRFCRDNRYPFKYFLCDADPGILLLTPLSRSRSARANVLTADRYASCWRTNMFCIWSSRLWFHCVWLSCFDPRGSNGAIYEIIS